jgi:hypothetical protein
MQQAGDQRQPERDRPGRSCPAYLIALSIVDAKTSATGYFFSGIDEEW